MIQALGMLKLLDDISSEEPLIPGWENFIEEYKLHRNDELKYIELTDKNSVEWLEIDEKLSKKKDLKKVLDKHTRYLLKNSIAYLEFKAVKYFYDFLDYCTDK